MDLGSLRELLTVDLLKKILAPWQKFLPKTKTDLLHAYIVLLNEAQLPSTLARLPADDLRQLAAIVHAPGRFTPAIAALIREPYRVPPPLHPWQFRDDGACDQLRLFFPVGGTMDPHLAQRLRAQLPSPYPARPGAPVVHDSTDGTDAPWDAALATEVILACVEQGVVEAREETLAKPTLLALGKHLGTKHPLDALRFPALNLCLTYGESLRIDDQGRFHRTATAPILSFIAQSWIDSPLEEMTDLDLKDIQPDDLTPPVPRRRQVLASLAALPPQTWLAVTDLLAHLRLGPDWGTIVDHGHLPAFVHSRKPEFSLTSLPPQVFDWIDECWVRAVLAYANALGMVEVRTGHPPELQPALARVTSFASRGWASSAKANRLPTTLSAADTIVACRMTAFGAWILGIGPQPAPETESGSWRIQADGTIVCLSSGIPAKDRLILGKIADVVDERSWRITRDRLMMALTEDLTPRVLRETFERLHQGPLPATVAALVDEAVRRTSCVTVSGPLMVLTLADVHAHQTLLHDRSTAPLVQDLGQQRLGVAPDDLKNLRKKALKLGWHIP